MNFKSNLEKEVNDSDPQIIWWIQSWSCIYKWGELNGGFLCVEAAQFFAIWWFNKESFSYLVGVLVGSRKKEWRN